MYLDAFLGALGGASIAGTAVGFLAKSLIEHRLQINLEEQKLVSAERATVRAAVDKYARVILISSSDLQDRLWHLCARQSKSKNKVLLAKDDLSPIYGSWPMTKRHYLVGTMYLVSRYLCWIEVLKRQVRLLEFGDEDKTNEFNYHLKKVERMFAETDLQKFSTNKISTDKPLFQLMQVEIGEHLMVEISGSDQCVSFHEFKMKYDEYILVNEGLRRLEELIVGAMSDADSNFCLSRLTLVCNALLDLIIFLNEDRKISPPENLEKVPIANFNSDKFLEVWPLRPIDSINHNSFNIL